jgi:hypothetical protein
MSRNIALPKFLTEISGNKLLSFAALLNSKYALMYHQIQLILKEL